MMRPGPLNSITDVPGLLAGSARDDALKSGVTVVTAETRLAASVCVLGGAPGTRETDLLDPAMAAEGVDALVLSGGSAFGLGAAEGVMAALREAGRGVQVGPVRVPVVPAAILFDLLNGGDKGWTDSPYPALGRQAFLAAGRDLALGSEGAGTGAQTGMMKGGLGAASFVLGSGVTVAALVAANPVGSATTPGERHFWAAPFEQDGEFGGLGPDPRGGLGTEIDSRKLAAAQTPSGNTTIAIVATDAMLNKAQLKRVAMAAHDGIGRAIVPAHTPHDGDLVFSASTGLRPLPNDPRALTEIGHAAAICLARAIARGVWLARPSPGDLLPAWSTANA